MCRADLHVPIVLKSGSLNLLEPSGPVQACLGTALLFTFNYCSFNCTAHSLSVTSRQRYLGIYFKYSHSLQKIEEWC